MSTEPRLQKLMRGPGTCFRDLPTEIRIQILEYALSFEIVRPYHRHGKNEVKITNLLPSLGYLDASSLMEAEQVLFGINVISLTFAQFCDWMGKRKEPRWTLRLSWMKKLLVTFTQQDYCNSVRLNGGPLMCCSLQDQHSYYKLSTDPTLTLQMLQLDFEGLCLFSSDQRWAKDAAQYIGGFLTGIPAEATVTGAPRETERTCILDIMLKNKPTPLSARWHQIQAYWSEVNGTASSSWSPNVWEHFVTSGRLPRSPSFPWTDSNTGYHRGSAYDGDSWKTQQFR